MELIQQMIITPELASDYLKFNTFNRPLDKQLVKTIANDIQRGAWIYDGTPIRFDEDGYLIDGQHRLAACIEANLPIESDVIKGLSKDAFKVIDTGRGRSAGSILGMMNVQNANIVSSSISSYFALKQKKATSSTTRHSSQPRSTGKSKQAIVDFYLANRSLCNEVGSAATSIGNGYHGVSILYCSTIGSYCLYLILEKGHTKERVFSFFRQLITGREVENRTILLLRDKLIRHKTGESRISPQQRDVFIKKTWNAFIKGEENLSRLSYYAEKESNIDLL